MECVAPGRVLVGPGPETYGSPSFAAQLREELRVDFEFEFGIEDVLRQYHLEPPKGPLPFIGRVPEGEEANIAARLTEARRVRAAIPDYLVRPSGPPAPLAIHASVIDQAIKDLHAQPGSTRCGEGCIVGILDSGVDGALLSGTKLTPHQYDALAPTALTAPSDAVGHGTLVARIISMTAPAATLLPVKTFDRTGTISAVIAALYIAQAAGPCDVLNMSLSVSCTPERCKKCHAPAPAAANIAQLSYFFQNYMRGAPNTILVAAAGNNVSQVCLPAQFNNVIAVGSFDYAAQSPISAYQSVPVDRFVLAPGGQGLPGKAFGERTGFRGPDFMHGTSFATAFVSGFALRTACSWKGLRCGRPLLSQLAPIYGSGLLATILGEIAAKANKWSGFNLSQHGLGALQF